MADGCDDAELNFFRLLKAFLNCVNEALRLRFKQQWHETMGQEWENNKKSGQFFIEQERLGKKKSKLFTPEYAKVLDLISDGDVSKWDPTALFFALLYSKSINLTDPSKGYRRVVVCRMKPLTLGEHIDHLREIRQYLVHIEQPRIEKKEFQRRMNIIVDAVSAIVGEDHEILASIHVVSLQTEDVFKLSTMDLLRRKLVEERQNAVFFYQNLEKLEGQIKNFNPCKKEAIELSSGDQKDLEENCTKNHSSTENSIILPEKNRIQRTSEKLKWVQSCVLEIMYPNRPELEEDYQKLINTSNKFSYEFEWDNFNGFIDQMLLEKNNDCDMALFAKIQLAKGLSHQGKKEESLKMLNELVSHVYKAKNSAVILARIFYRLAYIFNDLKDVKKANENIVLAEQILSTSESYEDRAEIHYAKANISLVTCSADDQHVVIGCLNNTIDATQKSVVDMLVLERQALIRNALVHLGFLQHTIKIDVKASDVRAASELLNKFLNSCSGELSKRNQLFKFICQCLLAYHQSNHHLATELGDKACDIAVKYGLSYEMKQIKMLKSLLQSM